MLASEGQVNGIVPFGLPVDAPALLVLTHGDFSSEVEGVEVVAAQPGIFTVSQTGEGQGVIVRVPAEGGKPSLADSQSPARPSDSLVIYCTGLGAVAPAVEAGAPAPAEEPLARVVADVGVTVGGLAAQVSFAGLVPNFAALYQVNVELPPGVAPGADIPVVVTVAGAASPSVTIAVAE